MDLKTYSHSLKLSCCLTSLMTLMTLLLTPPVTSEDSSILCSPEVADVTFLETDTNGTCSRPLVTCVDTTSVSGIPLSVVVSSDPTQSNVTIRATSMGDGTTNITACVTRLESSPLLPVGQFQILAEVSTVVSSGKTSLSFDVTVMDVNQPPYFDSPSYSEIVNEDAAFDNSVVAVVRDPTEHGQNCVTDIVRGDPDTVTESFRLANEMYSVSAWYKNGTVYQEDVSKVMGLNGSRLEVWQPLHPHLDYVCILIVEDGEGLTASTTVTVEVNEVKEIQDCRGDWVPIKKTVDLMQPVNSTVAHRNTTCRDNGTFHQVQFIASGLSVDIIRAKENGDFTLRSPIPRFSQEVSVIFGVHYLVNGSFNHIADLELKLCVLRDYPPQCQPDVVLPVGFWQQGNCFRIYPNCSDPTTPPGDTQYLTYTFNGNWTGAITQRVHPSSTQSYGEFCYQRTTSGTYIMNMEVDNGLGARPFQWAAKLSVLFRVPPSFTETHYLAEVKQNVSVGSSVVRVEAEVGGQEASLIYSLSGDGLVNSNMEQYFSINSTTGQVVVAASLLRFVDNELRGYVTAEDLNTGLSHSVPLTIKVVDINHPPTCAPQLNVTIPWKFSVADTVVTLTCSDPDLSTLTYEVTEGGDMWNISQQGEIRLLSRDYLQPILSNYELNVTVSDGVWNVFVSVNISVDRTAPQPRVSVTEVLPDSARIIWTFDLALLPVVQYLTLSLTLSSSSPIQPLTKQTLSKNLTSYVISNLTSNQRYDVVVTVVGLDGSLHNADVSFVTPSMVNAWSTELHLVAQVWTTDLANNQSIQFRTLQTSLQQAVHTGLQNLTGYVSTRVRSFRPGSVIADMVVITNKYLSGQDALQSALDSLVSSGNLSGVLVNASYSPLYTGEHYIVDPSLTYTYTEKIVDSSGLHLLLPGGDVTATCRARTPGFWHPVIQWQFGGHYVSRTGSSRRFNVSEMVRSDADHFQVSRSLAVERLLVSDSGTLQCRVMADQLEASSQVTLHVVTRLSATLTPPTTFLTPGSNITLKCARIAGYDADWSAVFYRVENGRPVEVGRAKEARTKNSTDLTLHNVTSDSRYQCNVTDDYGWALSTEADVIIRQKDLIQCPGDGIWLPTPAGNLMRLPCPEGYNASSLQQRLCSEAGEWDDVDTTMCVRSDLQDLQTLIEEETTTNATWRVVERVANITSGPLLGGDVSAVAAILEQVVKVTEDSGHVVETSQLQDFLKIADNVLQAPREAWINQTGIAQSLVHSVDQMAEAAFSQGVTLPTPLDTDNIVLELRRVEVEVEDVEFPDKRRLGQYPPWVREGGSSVFLSRDAFPDTVREVGYSVVMYRNLTNVFSTQLDPSLAGQEGLSINSPILAMSVQQPAGAIRQPVTLTFDLLTSNVSNPSCQFLDFSTSTVGEWSGSGCRVTSVNATVATCQCDHLTNFAVLVSPYRHKSTLADVLNVFSIVGCGVSIFCLLLTIIIYRVFWRYVKSDRSVILMNLCVMLILAYVTFLAGVNRVQYKLACTVVAVLLHYLWLVVFFLMLCEGLDIFVSVVIVFPTKSVLCKLLLMAYGVPVIIVGVALGITRLEGYGGTDFCWLSLKNDLLWAFVGPALATLLANYVFVALVIRALLSTTVMITKANRKRAKSVVKAVCVMTPILGLCWVFGVMAVSDDTLVFQVLFVVFNSLQGLMIFVFHCLLSKQVREGFQSKRRQQSASSAGKYSGSGGAKDIYKKRFSESSLSSDNDVGRSASPGPRSRFQRMDTQLSLLDSPTSPAPAAHPHQHVDRKGSSAGPSTTTTSTSTSTFTAIITRDQRSSVSPADRWVRAGQAVARQRRQHPPPSRSRSPPYHGPPFAHHDPDPDPDPNPYPYPGPSFTSPRRLSTSSDALLTSSFHPFSFPRQGELLQHVTRSTRSDDPPADY
ncbi:uncharacterized protein LOC143283056 isoform X2 [Babylonia areolata]|uniref:uncharacterized protein LOC143283056 isoform X2 n=1 Tax=Babylonia areolata TaxID=304850 RepID=UPI003FD45A32